MGKIKKPNGYWNFERCVEESKKYKTKTEFQKKSYGAYKAAKRNNWLDLINSNMIEIIKPKNYWNLENSIEESKKYNTKKEFQKKSYGAYRFLLDNKILDDHCFHMTLQRKPNGYWNFENCQDEALKYNTKKEFERNSSGAYNTAIKHKWIDKICTHMKISGNMKKRYVYACEFIDNHVYIGLTCNIDRRKREHFGLYKNRSKKTSVLKHIEKTSLLPEFKLLTIESLTEKEVVIKEEYFLNEYKKNGWMILNRMKTGGLLTIFNFL